MLTSLGSFAWVFGGAIAVALAVDHVFGEPSGRWHPVVWIGNALSWATPWVLQASAGTTAASKLKCLSRGALVNIAFSAIVLLVTITLQSVLLQLPGVLAALLMGLALKPLLAWAMLRSEVQAVECALAESLQAGRERLSWLVSRDTSLLSESEVRQSAIESMAENLNDSVVAPLFWFFIFGLPGAAVYRFANTADAMWGYKGVRNGQNWEWAGKWAAHMDDMLSYLPARLTALLMALIGGGISISALLREAAKTPSPNSGWPMAAMALLVNIQLCKPGVYTLNSGGRSPQPNDTVLAQKYASKVIAALLMIGLAATLSIALWQTA